MAQTSSKKCALCSNENGLLFCYDCRRSLCDICRSKHDKIPSTKGHTITDLQNVDLATFNCKSQCDTHEREFMCHCIRCSVLICSKCVTSTHKDHSFSEISEMVSNEREIANTQLPEINSKIESISALKENVRCKHLNNLEKDSTNVVEDINSTCKELLNFFESKRDIKITEIEDNEKIERQNLESFIQNVDRVNKLYRRVSSELENILSEKHDITFFMCYNALKSDIRNLDKVPEPPKLVEVKPFDKKLFFQDIVDYIQSNVDGRATQNMQQKDDEIKMFKQKIGTLEKQARDTDKRATQNMQQKDDEIKMLKQKTGTLEKQARETGQRAFQTMQQNEDETKMLKQKIDTLEKQATDTMQRDIQNMEKKDDELNVLQQKIDTLENTNRDMKFTAIKNIQTKNDEVKTLQKKIDNLARKASDIEQISVKEKQKKDEEIKELKQKIDILENKTKETEIKANEKVKTKEEELKVFQQKTCNMESIHREAELKASKNAKKKEEELKTLQQKIDTLENKNREAELKSSKDIQKKEKELKVLQKKVDFLEYKSKEMHIKSERRGLFGIRRHSPPFLGEDFMRRHSIIRPQRMRSPTPEDDEIDTLYGLYLGRKSPVQNKDNAKAKDENSLQKSYDNCQGQEKGKCESTSKGSSESS